MYACLYRPPSGERELERDQRDQRSDRGDRRETSVQEEKPSALSAIAAFDNVDDLIAIAQEFSPRYESRGGAVAAVVIDIRGLDRLLGDARTIGEELRREAARRGVRVHVAMASTRTASLVLAITNPGLTVVQPGGEPNALAPLPIGILERIGCARDHAAPRADRRHVSVSTQDSAISAISAFKRWGLRTLGELAALPPAALSARLGRQGLSWQALARGDDIRPLVPDAAEERFESVMDLEWPIEGLDPMSFVLTRLLEPLSIRLERRDRGVAVLHVQLRLVGGEVHARSLQLPSPMRDVRTLRTLALLDLESHPPAAAIERVAIAIDPTPARIVQHTLFASPQLTPEQLSTLLARLGAVMGQDRIGAPATVDSYRPGAFAMKPFAPGHEPRVTSDEPRATSDEPRPTSPEPRATVLRRCRQPVPGRVAADADGRPVRVTTDRRGFAGGTVVRASGPWKTSGEWWNPQAGWDRDEWDVTLTDGGAYRVFMDRATHGWYIDAIYD
jgi:protein ImuB